MPIPHSIMSVDEVEELMDNQIDKKYLPPLIYLGDDAHYRIGFPSLLFSWWLYYHEQKHIIKAVQIYNGEVTYTPQNPFK